jgi:hypothetical protein
MTRPDVRAKPYRGWDASWIKHGPLSLALVTIPVPTGIKPRIAVIN